jgi:hypothetical protein
VSVESHDIYSADAAPYLLGALTELEVQRFEAHAKECPICRDEVDRLRPAVEALPRSAPPVRPPAGLKASLMEVVEAEAGERGRAPSASHSVGARARPRPFARLRERLAGSGEGWAGARPALAWASVAVVLFVGGLAGYAATQLTAEGTDEGRTLAAQADEERLPSASGSLVVHSSGEDGGVLRVQGMPPLDRDSVYQVWVRRGGETISQSMFSVGQNGEGAAAVADDLRGADSVMVTREDTGGAKAPSENPVMTVSL